MIRVVPSHRQMVTGAYPTPRGIESMGHVIPWYPAGPVVPAVTDHIGNETLTPGADGQFTGNLPSNIPPGIGEDNV